MPERAQQRPAFGRRASSFVHCGRRLELGGCRTGCNGPVADLAKEAITVRAQIGVLAGRIFAMSLHLLLHSLAPRG
ncbi:MAG: hypothetical protein P8Y53_17735, partial [Pseudolabrys sp.]